MLHASVTLHKTSLASSSQYNLRTPDVQNIKSWIFFTDGVQFSIFRWCYEVQIGLSDWVEIRLGVGIRLCKKKTVFVKQV